MWIRIIDAHAHVYTVMLHLVGHGLLSLNDQARICINTTVNGAINLYVLLVGVGYMYMYMMTYINREVVRGGKSKEKGDGAVRT